jgi:DNA ligase-associated metallophosphoesterase
MNSFDWNGLALLPQRAVWRDDARTLFVADVHIGKAAHFRALGVPAPAGTTQENLGRLDALIDALNPRTLVVLGDLFHAPAAWRDATRAEFAAWRARRAALKLKLVAGNHDARAGLAPSALDIEWVEEPHDLDGLVCRHIPPEADDSQDRSVLAGHWHPAARLHGPGRDRLRLPCFLMSRRRLVLPAFGEFTGGAAFEADEDCALLATTGERLVHLPARPRARTFAVKYR